MMLQPQQSQEALKKIGLSASIIAGITVIVLASFVYKNYLETKRLRLEIKKLNKEGFE